VFDSKPVMREWWTLESDHSAPPLAVFLMVADLAVFLDYGHWRLVPALEQPLLQTLGLALYLAVAIWQIWTDTYRARYFSQENRKAVPMDHGLYLYVRRPRYAAAIVAKAAVALALASVLGWVLVAACTIVMLRKIAIEEAHLRNVFGTRYEDYSQRTAKALPGIY